MKFSLRFLFLLLPVFLLSFAFQDNSRAIVNALQKANAREVTAYFASAVDVKFPAQEEMKNAGKAEASQAFISFFEKNHIHNFQLTSQRELSGTMYITGKIEGNKNYNLTLLMRQKEGNLYIISVRIN
jgi:outer membrane lipoprotein-sorting protein